MKKSLFIALLFACSSIHAKSQAEKVFTEIYQYGFWDANGNFSENGSNIEESYPYVQFLEDFLKKNQIQSVVDLGCGDWALSRFIDWEGIEYTGYDVVEEVIERNQKAFAKPSITFVHADGIKTDLPQADLFICKDVLHYLPNAEILRLLPQLKKYKHCLITYVVDHVTFSSDNRDMAMGTFRSIDLRKAPFEIDGKIIFGLDYSGLIKLVMYFNNPAQDPL